MVSFLTDEDFNGRIIRGLFLRRPDLNLVRVIARSVWPLVQAAVRDAGFLLGAFRIQ